MGAGASVPDVIDEAAAKSLCGDKWTQEAWDKLRGDGETVTKEQFMALATEGGEAAPAEEAAAPALAKEAKEEEASGD